MRSFLRASLLLTALFRWRRREVGPLSFTKLIYPTSVDTSAALERLLLLHYSVYSDRTVKQKCFDATQCARCSKLMILIKDSKGQSPKYLLTHNGIVRLLQQTPLSAGLLLNVRHFLWVLFSYSELYRTQMLSSVFKFLLLLCFSSTVAVLLFPLLCERGSVYPLCSSCLQSPIIPRRKSSLRI